MKTKLLELARSGRLLGKAYRVYLKIKRLLFRGLGFRIAVWYSKDGKIISCNSISKETYNFFVNGSAEK